jgi:3-hydroxyisobutyrate dehydrogenase-like beta-hydroxyacid dehydrogenase
MDLGLSAGEKLGVPMPVAAATREIVQQAIDAGETERDFGILLELQAEASGMELTPENVDVDNGLS